MQQKYREVLTSSPVNLKRWEIGDIASRIGQLYYLYYLRTSDISFLNQSYTFYTAIRNRNYFKCDDIPKDSAPRAQLAGRVLRYYARYLVVCLLLGLGDEIADPLVTDMSLAFLRYKTECSPSARESAQWLALIDEAKAFLARRAPVSTRDPTTGNKARVLESGRLKSLTKETQQQLLLQQQVGQSQDVPQGGRLQLQTAILAGGRKEQIKVGDLALDTLRMAHSLEVGLACQKKCPQFHNPVKHMLRNPSAAQLIFHMAAVTEDLAKDRAMLLYITGDAGVDGGFAMNNGAEDVDARDALTAADIVPYTRWPLFMIADGVAAAEVFGKMEDVFRTPFLCLMAPKEWETEDNNGLFTLFLHQPLAAFCVFCGLFNPNKQAYNHCMTALNEYFEHLASILENISRKYNKFVFIIVFQIQFNSIHIQYL